MQIPIPKNMHIGKLDNIVNRNKNTCHSPTKTKPINVKSSTCIDFGINKDPKFKADDM